MDLSSHPGLARRTLGSRVLDTPAGMEGSMQVSFALLVANVSQAVHYHPVKAVDIASFFGKFPGSGKQEACLCLMRSGKLSRGACCGGH